MTSSSEFADSGRFSGQRAARAPEKSSNFSQTCNLLSQYLKEKGTFGDLGLGITRGLEGNGMSTPTMNLFPVANKSSELSVIPTRTAAPARSLTSMELFPQHSGFGSTAAEEEVINKVDSSANKSEPETAQMTIFYAGQVIVFNDFPADKAEQIMFLAGKGSSPNTTKPIEPTNLIPTSSSTVVPNFVNNLIQEHAQQPAQPVVSDLPIARKASLARFLEKRKDRIVAKAPYPTSNSTAYPSKPAETKSWLGLAAQTPVPFEHQF
ncbi:Protein TIFY 10A like [Actinidia chinensis var. chinensis]|uniref:Protein TIFY n=1 Tax=Actinidia chinensis var. chinensis TaxID=1590841 RepID=A0A2R6Q590_ACTCC|nr:Protein TIFY 10A like [Actinidia chinensis var. chinensis]